jgi:hypothetical protein
MEIEAQEVSQFNDGLSEPHQEEPVIQTQPEIVDEKEPVEVVENEDDQTQFLDAHDQIQVAPEQQEVSAQYSVNSNRV